MVLRLEWRCIEWMVNDVTKFFNVEELVVDTFACTFETAKARLQLPKRRRFAGCGKDSA